MNISNLKPDIQLQQRLKLAMPCVMIILIVATAAGIVAVRSIQDNLEEVAWDRVARGESVTKEHLESERERVENLAVSISAHPEFIRLLKDANAKGLSTYISALQTKDEADFVIVQDAVGQTILGGGRSLICSQLQRKSPADYCVIPGTDPLLVLVAGRSVKDGSNGRLVGYVTVGTTFDNEQETKLAAHTGLAQSILIDYKRVATSLETESMIIDDEAYEQVIASGQSKTTKIVLDGRSYYELLFPIRDTADSVIAVAEVDFSATKLVAVEGLTLFVFIFLFMMFVSIISLAVYLTKKRMQTSLTREIAEVERSRSERS